MVRQILPHCVVPLSSYCACLRQQGSSDAKGETLEASKSYRFVIAPQLSIFIDLRIRVRKDDVYK